ncbi:lymphocyte antigen 6 complex locus protein G6c-like [Crotalus tigris]|uniref:lymphocyte antigen 6 complex locus protein G6c-like n=1 Tax=Crotalus tigris TaxID=88082 RepID=UPI00192F8F31|nr:lymphocyte antigen 6 complex locus protein G6c-like [Crotalus tigris]
MKNFVLLVFSVLLFCTVAQGLVCNVCDVKLGYWCVISGEPCRPEEGQLCEVTEVYLAGFQFFKKYGCGEHRELCGKSEERDTPFKRTYKRTCCDTDLCNKD